MADLIIPDLDDAILIRLKRKAWEQGLPLAESLRRSLIASLDIGESHAEMVAHAYQGDGVEQHGGRLYS